MSDERVRMACLAPWSPRIYPWWSRGVPRWVNAVTSTNAHPGAGRASARHRSMGLLPAEIGAVHVAPPGFTGDPASMGNNARLQGRDARPTVEGRGRAASWRGCVGRGVPHGGGRRADGRTAGLPRPRGTGQGPGLVWAVRVRPGSHAARPRVVGRAAARRAARAGSATGPVSGRDSWACSVQAAPIWANRAKACPPMDFGEVSGLGVVTSLAMHGGQVADACFSSPEPLWHTRRS
jgi:hypothetical protein